ncbi:probable phosphatase phospho2 [Cylas formicarius]|uniref:probable phosphatase phospho2 n=1 Tax=Cylas formicarius TaxID=197179 RepID=UPI002958AE30|nr:probable phosphatase phospho2 [Cylas formicarius]
MIGLFKRAAEIQFTHILRTMKNLAVFDFDYTIIDDNSDTAVAKLVAPEKITKEIRQLHKHEGWTSFMQGVFSVLHENKVTEYDISDLIRHIPAVDGMKGLITELYDNFNFDIIIISDSNTYFIKEWLEESKLDTKVLKVFSNPAVFKDNGLLKIEMYHVQDCCKLSTRNLCKGKIMEDFIKSQMEKNVNYNRVFYVGDGYNDLCPILRLKDDDVACVRDKYKCSDLVQKSKCGTLIESGIKCDVKAQVCVWTTGKQILQFIKENY